MPITLRSTLLLTLSLSTLAGAGLAGSALATEPDPLQCAERFRNVRSVRYQPSNAKEYFEHGKGPAFWVKPFIPMRKVLLSGLYQLRRRPYPIIVLDNDTPKKANFLARSFFNRLNEQDAAYALDDVKKELETTLAYVKSYPQDIAAFVDAEATYRLQRLALEDALDQIANPKPGQGHGFPWVIELPVTKGESVKTEKKMFNDARSIKSEIGLINDRLALLKGNLSQDGSFENRAYQQALNIELLKAYRAELKNQILKDEGIAVPAEAQALLDKLNSTIGIVDGKIPRELSPPRAARENIQWTQLRRELQDFSLTNALPSNPNDVRVKLPSDSLPGKRPQSPAGSLGVGDLGAPGGFDTGIGIGIGGGGTTPGGTNVGAGTGSTASANRNALGKVVDLVNGMSDDEKEAVGLKRPIAYAANFMRNKWFIGSASIYTLVTQGPKPWIEYLPEVWQNYIASDEMRRRICAVKDEPMVAGCVVSYLKEKHPYDYALQTEKGELTLLVIDPKTKQPVMNKQIQAEFDELMQLRIEYTKYKAREMDFEAIVSRDMAMKDPTSDRWLQMIIATPDKEQFKTGLIAHFEAKSPLSFAPLKDRILAAIDAPADKQIELINQIIADNFDIGSRLNDIMYRRANAAMGYNIGGGFPIAPVPGNGAGGAPGGALPLPMPGGGANPGPLGSPYYLKPNRVGAEPTPSEIQMQKLEIDLRARWLHNRKNAILPW